MFNIEKYLEKFSKSLRSADVDKKKIIEIVKNQTGLDFFVGDIETKNGVIFLKSSPAVKNKIFIYKQKILDDLNKILKITDIR